MQVTRRLLVLLPIAALAKERLGDIPAPPTDPLRMYAFKEAWNAFTETFFVYDVKDQKKKVDKLWERTWNAWKAMLNL